MPAPDHRPLPALPNDTDDLLRLAAQSMFDTFAATAMGTMVVDRAHRIVWISEGYKRFLPALGHADERDFLGRRVEEVVPNTLMAQVIETGQPILVDLLTNKAGTFLVSRLPLRDATGQVIGAMGMVLLDHPETTMQPLIGKPLEHAEEKLGLRLELLGDRLEAEFQLLGRRTAVGMELLARDHRKGDDGSEFAGGRVFPAGRLLQIRSG